MAPMESTQNMAPTKGEHLAHGPKDVPKAHVESTTKAPTNGGESRGPTMAPTEKAQAQAKESLESTTKAPTTKESTTMESTTTEKAPTPKAPTTNKGKVESTKAPKAPKAPSGYVEGVGADLNIGDRVFNLGGAAKNGSVPQGEKVIELVTNLTKAAPGHNGQEYKKVHLESTKGPKVKRTKFLSMARSITYRPNTKAPKS